jgi:D-alanine-D-alanine ligase
MLRIRQSISVERGQESHAKSGGDWAHLDLLTSSLLRHARLAIVYGGDKAVEGAVIRQSRNPRSWKSYEYVARDIAASLERLGCNHVVLLPDDMRLASRLKQEGIQLAWLNTGGVQGRSSIGHAAAMLEMLGIPYIGHDPLTSAILDNKFVFKRQLMAIGIPTSPFVIWHPASAPMDPQHHRQFARVFGGWDGGFVVKPVTGRASLHVHYVERAADLAATAAKVFDVTQNDVLIEAYLPGREYCIAVAGSVVSRGGRLEQLPGPFTFAGVERVLGHDERVFTSMDVAPITRERVRVLDPRADACELDALDDLAATLYTEMPLKTLVRLDVRADRNGRLFVLEANPKPDLKAPDAKATSLIGAGLDRLGMTYDDLILSIFANRAAELLEDGGSITDSLEHLLSR